MDKEIWQPEPVTKNIFVHLPLAVVGESLPVKKIYIFQGSRAITEEQYYPQTIGHIMSALRRCVHSVRLVISRPFDKTDFHQRLRIGQVLSDVIACLVHERI